MMKNGSAPGKIQRFLHGDWISRDQSWSGNLRKVKSNLKEGLSNQLDKENSSGEEEESLFFQKFDKVVESGKEFKYCKCNRKWKAGVLGTDLLLFQATEN